MNGILKNILCASSFLVTRKPMAFCRALLLLIPWETLDRVQLGFVTSVSSPFCRAGNKQWRGGNIEVGSAVRGQ